MSESTEEFAEHLEALSVSYGTELSEPLMDCRTVILAGVAENFAGSHSSTGYGWPLRKDNKPHPLLILTGELEEAATGGAGSITRVVDGVSLEVGVDASGGESGRPWAALHQEGGTKMPPRPFMGFSDEVQDACEAVLTEWAIEEFCR